MPILSARLTSKLIHLSARFTRPLTIGVRAVILNDAGRVFLVRHSYVPGWHLPGGAVEAGESTLDALRREVREECAMEVVEEPTLHGIFFNNQVSRRDHVVVYRLSGVRTTGPREADWEIVETGFFAPDALPADTSRATRDRLAEILERRRIAPIW